MPFEIKCRLLTSTWFCREMTRTEIVLSFQKRKFEIYWRKTQKVFSQNAGITFSVLSSLHKRQEMSAMHGQSDYDFQVSLSRLLDKVVIKSAPSNSNRAQLIGIVVCNIYELSPIFKQDLCGLCFVLEGLQEILKKLLNGCQCIADSSSRFVPP